MAEPQPCAESSSLRDPHGRLHFFRGTIREYSLFSHSRYAPPLNSGKARRSALVAPALRGRPCPRRPPPLLPQQAATQCLQAPPSRCPVTVRSVRHWQKGTTPVLSVTRGRALVMVADCGISMWLPCHSPATRSKRDFVTVLFSDFGLYFAVLLNFCNFRNLRILRN